MKNIYASIVSNLLKESVATKEKKSLNSEHFFLNIGVKFLGVKLSNEKCW